MKRPCPAAVAVLATTLLAGAGFAAYVAHQAAEPPAPIVREEAVSLTGCGYERWAVKTLMDPEAGSVLPNPVQTTVAQLRALRPPATWPPPRRVAPVEITTYQLTVQLLRAHLEPDGDIHVVVSDPATPRLTMIVELPNAPRCAPRATIERVAAMETARQAFVTRFGMPPLAPKNPPLRLSGTAHILGVGFWDDVHGQDGVAGNAVELHPVLDFTVLP